MRVIGERINPTGKKRFQQALREKDMNYIVAQAVEQADAGAQILDINVGLPGIDEVDLMRRVVTAIGGAVGLPLQIDSSNPAAIEAGLRAAPGQVPHQQRQRVGMLAPNRPSAGEKIRCGSRRFGTWRKRTALEQRRTHGICAEDCGCGG